MQKYVLRINLSNLSCNKIGERHETFILASLSKEKNLKEYVFVI